MLYLPTLPRTYAHHPVRNGDHRGPVDLYPGQIEILDQRASALAGDLREGDGTVGRERQSGGHSVDQQVASRG